MLDFSLEDVRYLLDLVMKDQEGEAEHPRVHLQGVLSVWLEVKANPDPPHPVAFNEDAN